jgi:hypothetical protein
MVSLSNHHDETLPPEGEGEGTGEAFWEPSIFFRLHHLWHSSLAKGKRSQAVNQHPPMEVVGEVFGVIESLEKALVAPACRQAGIMERLHRYEMH